MSPPVHPLLSTARRLQLEADYRDDRLTALARQRRPAVVHWWGRRSRPGWAGACCYLCDQDIATWSPRAPMPEAARALIQAHRLDHVRELFTPRHHTREENR